MEREMKAQEEQQIRREERQNRKIREKKLVLFKPYEHHFYDNFSTVDQLYSDLQEFQA